MNVLILGSGGREDALAWRLRQSPSSANCYARPAIRGSRAGRTAMRSIRATRHAMVELARSREIELVVIGPEAPLVAGVGDALRAAGFAVFGPNAAAAQLEGSKGFTKDLCARQRHSHRGLCAGRDARPTRARRSTNSAVPVVIKADGLAAGKGVTVAMTRAEAEAAIAAAGDGPTGHRGIP